MGTKNTGYKFQLNSKFKNNDESQKNIFNGTKIRYTIKIKF